MKGGRRRGAGRPAGSGDKRLELVRSALEESRGKLIHTAIKLATGRKPDRVVLCKLLDKVLPSLHSQQVSGMLTTQQYPGEQMSLEDARELFLRTAGKAFNNTDREAGASKVLTAQVAGKVIGPDRQAG